MELIKSGNTYIAKTEYGEWAAKEAGFRWEKSSKTWRTTDPAKAADLAAKTGLSFIPQESYVPSLLAMEAKPQVTGDLWPTVREGRYALSEPDGTVKFYQVDKPQEGKWAGWTFLKVLASDTPYPIKDRATKQSILDRIAVNPNAAMARYGQEIGSCGLCGRTLTDETSRKLGIGPICRGKLGLESGTHDEAADSLYQTVQIR